MGGDDKASGAVESKSHAVEAGAGSESGERGARRSAVVDVDAMFFCRGCRYPLRGLTEPRCPECGRAFDPGDARTMYTKRVPGPVEVFFLRPPGWPMIGLTTATVLAAFAAGTAPGGYGLLFSGAFLLGMGVGALWVARGVLAVALSCRYCFVHSERRAVFRWLITPVSGVLAILLALSDVPMYVTFRASHGAMERFAAEVMALPEGAPMPARWWIGLYPVKSVERFTGGMRFRLQGAGFLEDCGFAYSPGGTPPADGEDHYEQLTGAWYSWLDGW